MGECTRVSNFARSGDCERWTLSLSTLWAADHILVGLNVGEAEGADGPEGVRFARMLHACHIRMFRNGAANAAVRSHQGARAFRLTIDIDI